MKFAFAIVLSLATLTACGLTPAQLQAIGPGDKAVCFHAHGPLWSTTTTAASANDGKTPTVNEKCEINAAP